MIFILTSWFAWNVYDYNYGEHADDHCNLIARDTGFHPLELFLFIDCRKMGVLKG